MRIEGVSDNTPAAKAGIQTGDVVKKLGGEEVRDVMSYMKVLSTYKKGDKTTVEVLRGKEIKVLEITF